MEHVETENEGEILGDRMRYNNRRVGHSHRVSTLPLPQRSTRLRRDNTYRDWNGITLLETGN